jgi:hypothetical protein
VQTIQGLSRSLKADGIFVVSMALLGIRDGLFKLGIWFDVEKELTVIDETTIYRPDGSTWIIKALTPQATTAEWKNREMTSPGKPA